MKSAIKKDKTKRKRDSSNSSQEIPETVASSYDEFNRKKNKRGKKKEDPYSDYKPTKPIGSQTNSNDILQMQGGLFPEQTKKRENKGKGKENGDDMVLYPDINYGIQPQFIDSPPHQSQPKINELCKFFKTGACQKGDDCPYSHNLKLHPCKFLHSTGRCINGSMCEFSHERLDESNIIRFMKNNGYTNLGLYYEDYKKNKELRANEKKKEAFNAKIAGSMLPETIKQDLVSKEYDYNYPIMYNERLVQEQRNTKSAVTRTTVYSDVNRMQIIQPTMQYKQENYPQNAITRINSVPENYMLNNQIGVRIAQPSTQVQLKSINQPTITAINTNLNYPQNIQTFSNTYVTSPPPKTISNIRSQVYTIPQGNHIKMNLQNQPHFTVAAISSRQDIIESNQIKRKQNVGEVNGNYRVQLRDHHYNDSKRKMPDKEYSSDKSEEYFKMNEKSNCNDDVLTFLRNSGVLPEHNIDVSDSEDSN